MTDDTKHVDAWARHEVEQRRRWRTLSHAQRLAWLWQAKLFLRRALGAART
jgi:hypothetical protein